MLSDSVKLKAPSSIHFLGLTKNPRDRAIMVSLDTTPYVTVRQLPPIGSSLFRLFYNESSLDPLIIHILVTSLSISHLQLHSWYYSHDPSPMI